MLNGYIIAMSVGAFAMLMLSLFVFFRNSKAKLNRLFLLFSVCAIGWILFNYLGGNTSIGHHTALLANRLTFLFVGMGVFALYLFTGEMVQARQVPSARLIIAINIAALIVSPTRYVVSHITVSGSTYNVEFGTGSILFFTALLINAIFIIGLLFRARTKSHGAVRGQINVVTLSFAIFLLSAAITNALIPLAFNYYGLTNIGALFIFVLIGGMAYAITKHKLFDVRLVVARSLGYVLSLVSLGVIFAAGTFALTGLFFRGTNINDNSVRWVYTVLAVLLAFVFAPLKHFFDKTTARIFFRDAYDPEVLFAQLNRLLVSTLDLNKLLVDSSEIIVQSIKSEFSMFILSETKYSPPRLLGNSKRQLSHMQVAMLSKVASKGRSSMVVADDLEDDSLPLKKIMIETEVAVIIRLITRADKSGNELGYLLLGPKKSGNPYSSQDLRVLDSVANELVIAIQNALHFEEIQNFNMTLQQKVVEATNKLRRTNEKLKALDETKDDFISMASHQLRTPLTSVKGYLSMVLEGDAGKLTSTQREMLGQAFFSSQRMVYLIADLLNVSRLRTGKFVIELTKVNLADLVVQEMSQLTETAAAKSLKLIYHKPEHFPEIMIDETKTRQVVMNFMDNAIYYTPAGGQITIDLQDKPSTVELRVIDNGIGVPKAEQHHLFTKFYRAGNARKARPDGTGLGLFMAKKVITAQGGATIFNSEEGKGSTFGFTFSKTDHAVTPQSSTPVAVKAS